MFREIVSIEPCKAEIRNCDDRVCNDNEVEVSVQHAAAKHGTEFAMFTGKNPFAENIFDETLNMFLKKECSESESHFMEPGNMWVGVITKIGNAVKNYKVGDRVAGYGGFKTKQVVAEDSLLKMNERMTWQEAMCYDPMHFALGGIRDAKIKMGDSVVIFGLGAIGLICAQLAKLSGASCVIVCDPIESRRKIAIEYGADYDFDPSNCDVGLEIRKITENRGADVVIETSGNYHALQQSIRSAGYIANIAVVGWYKECNGGLNFGMEAHFNQPNIFFSRACSEPNRLHPRWSFERLQQTCWDMLSSGKIQCEKIIYPVVSFDSAAQVYMDIEKNAALGIKLGIDYSL